MSESGSLSFRNATPLGLPRQSVLWVAAIVCALNVLGWLGLFELAASGSAVLGMGLLAFLLGLRHAFDADHIAAIDNVTRKLRHDGRPAASVGLSFSLGHSTVVVLLSAALGVAAHGTTQALPALQQWGGLLGSLVSAGFLTLIALLNLVIFRQLWRAVRRGGTDRDAVEREVAGLLEGRGFISRLFKGIYRRIDRGWKMYPVGFLFGLGFDTATEIAVLALSAAAARSGQVPWWGVLTFPTLFAAGMTLMDSVDGILLAKAYDWALADAHRKLTFNTVITGLTVIAALVVGAVEWLQVLQSRLEWRGAFWQWLARMDFEVLGVTITAVILLLWLAAFAWMRLHPGAED